MKKKIKNIFFKNFFNLSINQLINIVFTLIITPILFQKIEVESFGLVNLYFTVVMVISVMVGYGYNINAPKRIASFKNSIDTQNLTNEIISTRLYLGVIFLLISLLVIFFSPEFFYKKIFIFSLIIIISEAINPFFYFQGTDNHSLVF